MHRTGLVPCVLLALLLQLAASQDLVIENASREINLVSQVVVVQTKLTVKNSGNAAVDSVEFCHLDNQMRHAAAIEVFEGKPDEGSRLQPVESTVGLGSGAVCLTALLAQPLAPGKTTKLQCTATFTRLQIPLPEAVFQNEPQRMLYLDNAYILSPYKILKQTTKVKLPSKKVESYTKIQPVALSQNTLKYGEFADTPAFSREEVRLHYENNSPFGVATKMTREVEISHWGNAYVEELYVIEHTGAKLRGEWSRLELMRSPEAFSQSAIRGFLAQLPLNAHSIYFKDAIGNISSSQVRGGLHTTEVILTPRYPLFGGWKAEFTLGYSLPLEDIVSKSKSGLLTAIALFGTPLAGVIIDEIENRVVLPEGSTVTKVKAPFFVEESSDTKYTYLDTDGRPVVVIKKKNVVFEHNVVFVVEYTFSTIHLLREPLLLIGVFAALFGLAILYSHCNLVITRDAAWQSGHRAERAAFLVAEITGIIAERENELLAASKGSQVQDMTALVERLKKSERLLNARCGDLEGLAGPAHATTLRELLEKERIVQARVVQIASSQGQSLQKGATKQIAAQRATEELKAVSSSLKQEHTEKLDRLT